MPRSWKRRNPKHRRPAPQPFEIRRDALLERLVNAEESKLILIEAPSGYGKTTLLGQFASESKRRVVWMGLTPDDLDTQTLSRSLAEAVATNIPDLPLKEWQSAASLGGSSERLAVLLANDLNLANENLVVIIENLEHAGADASSWLNAFLGNLGEGHQLIVSHYEESSLCPRIEGDIVKLTTTDLAFTPQECREFMARVDADLDPEEAIDQLEGWPAALAMVAHGAPVSTSADTLVMSIIKRLPAPLRDTLAEAAVLETWDEAAAKKVGCALPEGWLMKAKRAGLPMTPLGEGSYQPHRIIVEALEKLLKKQPERHAALHLAAARHAEANGQFLSAIDHLRVGGHTGEALRLIEDLLPRWQWRSDWVLIRKVLEPFAPALPPHLNTALGVALIETQAPADGERILKEQEAQGAANGWTHFGLSLLSYRRGNMESTLEHAREGLALVRDQRMVVLLLQPKAVALVTLGRNDEALDAAHECLKRAEALGDPSLLVRGLSLKQYVLRMKGELEASAELAHRAIELAFTAGTPNRALAGVIEVFRHHYGRGQAGEAVALVEKMLTTGTTEYPLAVPWMQQNLGYYHKQQGSFEVAYKHFLEAAAGFQKGGNLTDTGITLSEIIYCLLRLGQQAHAEAQLPKAQGFLLASDDHEQHATYYFIRGMAAFYRGDLDAATEDFERQKKERTNNLIEFDDIIALAYRAEISRRQGELSSQKVSALIVKLDALGHDWPLAALST